MEFLDHKVEFLGVCPDNELDMLKHIETCGRICYKSEHKIDWENESYLKFYKMLYNSGHVSAIEHSNIVVEIMCNGGIGYDELVTSFVFQAADKLSHFRFFETDLRPVINQRILTISANIRAWDEFFSYAKYFEAFEELANFLKIKYPNIFLKMDHYFEDRMEMIGSLASPSNFEYEFRIVPAKEQVQTPTMIIEDIPRYTFHVLTDRGISHEIVRHRVFSYSQESTRYINYKSKGIQFVNFPMPDEIKSDYLIFCEEIESMYNRLIELGAKPQFARNVLPNAIKTELTMTGRGLDYYHFINLRKSPAAHPSIRIIATTIEEIFDELDR